MQQMQEALYPLPWQISNLEDRLYLIATQLKAAGLFTAEACLIGGHGRGECAHDDDGHGFGEVHVNTMEGWWCAKSGDMLLAYVHKPLVSKQ
jgi:hypothetical protein